MGGGGGCPTPEVKTFIAANAVNFMKNKAKESGHIGPERQPLDRQGRVRGEV